MHSRQSYIFASSNPVPWNNAEEGVVASFFFFFFFFFVKAVSAFIVLLAFLLLSIDVSFVTFIIGNVGKKRE